jgi:hypothetical protein
LIALCLELSFILAVRTAIAIIRLLIIKRHLYPILVVARSIRVCQLLVTNQLVIIVLRLCVVLVLLRRLYSLLKSTRLRRHCTNNLRVSHLLSIFSPV